ncbi:PepSY domain-containing protein [Sphingomonas sp. 2R-10]|uniref:PepSY domain-containing protein n=1 Tax=Sphingomonas sp. 2R-10 TaxID=3045148 RepID=UPI000F7803CC|nr:PepSY domain-containing protein [Sphingomonas sp. 2R-10]MDJ0276441.1 PepSY domain-containing protein [Sphingomonas sp. 2R-10]
MKVFFAAIALTFVASPVLADTPGANWLPSGKVGAAIAKQGYQMTKVEADDGHWEGEMTKNGRLYEFHADPRTGKLMSVKPKHRGHD